LFTVAVARFVPGERRALKVNPVLSERCCVLRSHVGTPLLRIIVLRSQMLLGAPVLA
jgi:hypothetical protein